MITQIGQHFKSITRSFRIYKKYKGMIYSPRYEESFKPTLRYFRSSTWSRIRFDMYCRLLYIPDFYYYSSYSFGFFENSNKIEKNCKMRYIIYNFIKKSLTFKKHVIHYGVKQF